MKLRLSLKWIHIALVVATLISYMVTALTIYNLRVLPGKYLFPALATGGIIMLIVLIVAWRGRRSSKIKIAISIVCIVIIALSAYAYNIGQATTSLLSNISTTGNSETHVDTTKPFTIYISGIDSTDDPMSNTRSDVNILAVVNPQTHKILLVNTPRDYYVQLHGTTGARDKLTHAGIYGIDMSVKTLEDLYDTPIDYYLRVNFSSLTRVVDALGGITVESDYVFTAEGVNYQQGPNTLSGKEALIFARERKSFSEGDRTRGENQQRVIEAIIRKASDRSIAARYTEFLDSVGGALRTDMSSDHISSLINTQLDSIPRWQTTSISVNGTDSHNVTYSMGNISLYVMEPDISSLNEAKQKILQYRRK